MFEIGDIRNLMMEKIATTLMFPCKYSSMGCTAQMGHPEKHDHEEACDYR